METGISSGLVGHLARMQTLPYEMQEIIDSDLIGAVLKFYGAQWYGQLITNKF